MKNTMFNLKGDVAVVTGASSGLGKQMAEAFAKQGANLAILARRFERLEAFKAELEEKYKVKVLPIACDITKSESIDAAAEAVEKEYGKVDILLNCAGASKDKGVLDMAVLLTSLACTVWLATPKYPLSPITLARAA